MSILIYPKPLRILIYAIKKRDFSLLTNIVQNALTKKKERYKKERSFTFWILSHKNRDLLKPKFGIPFFYIVIKTKL